MELIYFLTRPNNFGLPTQAWFQVVQEHPKFNKQTKKKKASGDQPLCFWKSQGVHLPVEHLGYVMRCLGSISA